MSNLLTHTLSKASSLLCTLTVLFGSLYTLHIMGFEEVITIMLNNLIFIFIFICGYNAMNLDDEKKVGFWKHMLVITILWIPSVALMLHLYNINHDIIKAAQDGFTHSLGTVTLGLFYIIGVTMIGKKLATVIYTPKYI